MKQLLLLFAMLISTSFARAEELRERHELTFAPAISYSSERGVGLGGNVGVGFLLSRHWQITTELGFLGYSSSSWGSLDTRIGAQYNFSSETANSAYVGAGVYSAQDVYESSREGLFVRGGYRLQLGSEAKISWSPWIGAFVSNQTLIIGIMPFGFSLLF